MPGLSLRPLLRRPGPQKRPSRGSMVGPLPSAPATPSTPSPADTATALYTVLSWAAAGQAWADIYVSPINPPALAVAGYVGTSYVPTLLPGTTYYWKIVASNAGGSTTGPVWSFTTPAATAVLFTFAGVDVTARVRADAASIRDLLNAAPNTASLLVDTTAPTEGQAVRIGLGSLAADALLFGGQLQTVDESYVDHTDSTLWPVTLIDHTFAINKRRPFGTWTDVSATAIAQAIIAAFAPSFTATWVQGGLPTVSITFDGAADFMTCMGRLANAISSATAPGYTYVDYNKGVHLFLTEATDAPDPLDASHPPLNSPAPIVFSTDLSQIRTRVYGKGHGETVPVDVAAGETLLPVTDAVQFNASGGQAITGTTAEGAQSQIVDYTGVQLASAGSLVGAAATPTVAPTLAVAPGLGLVSLGIYKYAYTDVTAAGETLPSPLGSVTVGSATAVPRALAVFGALGGGVLTAGTYLWATTFVTAAGETTASPTLSVTVGGAGISMQLFDIPTGPALVTARKLYRTTNGGAQLKLVTTIADNTTVFYNDNIADGSLGANVPTSNTATEQQVAVSGIALGPSGTTSRKIYRTVAGGSQLKLQQTIADNATATGVQDATADGSLGANAPLTNTSGLSSAAAAGGSFYTSALVVFATNGAATLATSSAPVFTSATYTFVAGDVGAYVYIKSGTNWTPGFYLIVSVAGGAATLSGACASVASPTAATWGVDYSDFASPRFTFTDLAIDAVTATKVTSAALPIGPNVVGNVLNVTSGVGFAVQQAIVLSVSGVIATCDKVLGALASTGGGGTLGLAPLSPYLLAGDTTIPTSSAAPFSASGGWVALDGDQLVRYTGISGNTLTGVPASGIGAIVATVLYDSPIRSAPALTGINHNNGLRRAMAKGSTVAIWVERNDLAAQAALGQLELDADGNPTDGIHEYTITNGSRGEASLIAECDADLARFSTPVVAVAYSTRDPKTRSGKTVAIDLATFGIVGEFVIQDVTITFDGPALYPRYAVRASSVSFTLVDLLRRVVIT